MVVEPLVMASTIESSAVFESRASAVGVNRANIDLLQAAGITTLGTYAFSCTYTPGSDNDDSLKALLTEALGAAPNLHQQACLRRLFVEAHTLSIAEMRQRVERTEESAPRRMAAPERASRHEALQGKLKGLSLTGELEPAYALVDDVAQQYEDNTLRYIPIDRCCKREQELGGTKKIVALKADNQGLLRLTQVHDSASADVATDLKVRYALQRRALAYDQAGLLGFEIMDQWHDNMFRHLMRPPPEGYAAVTMSQMLRADAELFQRLSEATRSGIQLKPDGTRPLETAMADAVRDPSVTFLLMPLPRAASSRAPASHEAAPSNPGLKRTNEPAPGKGDAKRLKKANDKGKGKGKKGYAMMPPELAGQHSKTPDGTPICFAYNIRGCTSAAAGAKCGKGLHVCCRPGCYKNHASPNHV